MEIEQLGRWPGIEGRVALVTGASRGIGRATAQALALQGAEVVGTATTETGAAEISERLRAISPEAQGLMLNVADPSSVKALFGTLSESKSVPTILVNNAGIASDNLFARMKQDEWDRVLATNLSSLYWVCKAAIRGMMRARWGRIVNIASVVGQIGNPGQVNYAASKSGMIGFGKSLAREVATRNITVNTIAPGYIETDMTRGMTESQSAALRGQIPSGLLGAPEDVAAAVVYLASDAARYITGETLNVNGGLHMS
ncbi:MAG: 3-oxoacyl-ACP reductase FabG [Proteobacteria bacterium]|nr:3-oxoacyl-ACP reductase FabG [Pseudomonadota bacterium]